MQPFDDRVSIVMITRNRCGEADRALSHLAELADRPRVIVVDNGSADGTAQMVRTGLEAEFDKFTVWPEHAL